MADVVLNPGSGGSTVHTVTRTGKETQVVGLDLTPGGGSETLMNGVMPVSDGGGSLTVDNGGTFAVQADTELTTKDLDTGAGTDTQAVVGLVVAKSGGAANVSATDPLPIVQQGTALVQIQGGANTMGKLAANSGVVIGDVNVATLPTLPAGTNNIGDVDVLTAPWAVADNAAGLPPVVEVVGGYDGTNVQALATNAAGNLQVGLSAALPAGTAAIGKLSANSGVVIGDVNVVNTVTITGSVTADTELPAAAALADGAANPTAPAVGSFGLLWNGTTWDRAKGDATNGAFVNVKSSVLPTGAATAVKQPALGTAGAASADVLSIQGVASMTPVKTDPSGVTSPVSLASLPVLASGTNLVGRVQLDASTANGATPATYVSAASTNATSVKASAGQLYGVLLSNVNAAPRYLKIFNKASAPTVGTDTPLMNLLIPGNTAGAGSNVLIDIGVAFGTGIAFAITTGIALLDTGAVAASEITVTLLYK